MIYLLSPDVDILQAIRGERYRDTKLGPATPLSLGNSSLSGCIDLVYVPLHLVYSKGKRCPGDHAEINPHKSSCQIRKSAGPIPVLISTKERKRVQSGICFHNLLLSPENIHAALV
jgi:hypothetical protein